MKQAYLSITFLLLALVVTLPAQAKTPAPADTTLLDDLLAYWSLDESSGTRYDSHTRDVDLSDYDGTTGVTGVVGDAAFLDRDEGTNGSYLNASATLADTLSMGTGDYAIAFWARIDSIISNNMGLVHMGSGGVSGASVYTGSNGRIHATMRDDASQLRADASYDWASNLGTWIFIVANYDRDGDLTIYVDGVDKGSTDISAKQDSSIMMNVGLTLAYRESERLHGALDELGIWGRSLTQSEITWLYNSGNGRSYGDVVGLDDQLFSYWSLDESSGTRYDSHTRDVDLSDYDGTTGVTGVVGDAAFLDRDEGTNGSYLNASATLADTLSMGTGDYAIAFWARIDSIISNNMGLVHMGSGGVSGASVYTGSNGRIHATMRDDASQLRADASYDWASNLGTWIFIVANYDRDGDLTIYVDGVDKGSTDISAKQDSSIMMNVGLTLAYRESERLHGALDELGIWGRSLTQSEITWLYNSGNGRSYGDFCTDASTCNTGSGSQARGGELTLDAPTDELPQTLSLGHYPNPFNPQATITYDLPTDAPVRLEVFDLLGRRVALLVDAPVRAGTHQVRFDGSRLASGLYLYRMQALGQVRTGRMLLVK